MPSSVTNPAAKGSKNGKKSDHPKDSKYKNGRKPDPPELSAAIKSMKESIQTNIKLLIEDINSTIELSKCNLQDKKELKKLLEIAKEITVPKGEVKISKLVDSSKAMRSLIVQFRNFEVSSAKRDLDVDDSDEFMKFLNEDYEKRIQQLKYWEELIRKV